MNRIQVETTIIRRIGPLLAGVGLPAEANGANDTIEEALWRALQQLGYPPAAPLVVSDLDLASISVGRLAALLDLTELGCLEAAHAAAAPLVDTQAGERRDYFSQMGKTLGEVIAHKQAQIARSYPYLTPERTLRPARIDLNQSQRADGSDL